MTKEQANHILDSAKDGAIWPIAVIIAALTATGDIAPRLEF